MTTLVRFNPAREMLTLRNMMDRFFDDEFFGNLPASREMHWNLALDVMENEDAFVVTAAVPGVNPDDLEITMNDNVLTIKGEVREEVDEENTKYHLRERRYGTFTRSIALPTLVDADKIEAKYENGILTLTLPKAEAVKPKRIEVKAK